MVIIRSNSISSSYGALRYIYIYTYIEFCMGGSKVKTVLYFPYSAVRYEQCYVYYNNIEPDTHMAKNQKDFRWFSSAGAAMDKIVNVTNNEFVQI